MANESKTVAANYLVRKGHEIVGRNWRTRWCEIDIVSSKHGTLYFTEVKHRRNDRSGDGIAAITPTKHRKMTLAARMYVQLHEEARDHDLLLVAVSTSGNPPEVVDYIELV